MLNLLISVLHFYDLIISFSKTHQSIPAPGGPMSCRVLLQHACLEVSSESEDMD